MTAAAKMKTEAIGKKMRGSEVSFMMRLKLSPPRISCFLLFFSFSSSTFLTPRRKPLTEATGHSAKNLARLIDAARREEVTLCGSLDGPVHEPTPWRNKIWDSQAVHTLERRLQTGRCVLQAWQEPH